MLSRLARASQSQPAKLAALAALLLSCLALTPITISWTNPSTNVDSSVCSDLGHVRFYAILCGSNDSLLIADTDQTGREGLSSAIDWTPPRTGFTARLWAIVSDHTGNTPGRSNEVT